MKKIVIVIWLTSFLVPSFANVWENAYFGVSFGLSNTRTVKRDLTSDFGGGNMAVLGKKMQVSGNSNAKLNGQINLKSAQARGEQGFRVLAGYRMSEKLAFEFSYDKFSDAEFSESDGDSMTNSSYALGIQAVGSFPFFYEHVRVKPRVGISYLNSTLDFSGQFTTAGGASVDFNSGTDGLKQDISNLIWGLGFAYKWNKRSELTFDYIKYNGTGKIDDVDVIQVGMIYHFLREM